MKGKLIIVSFFIISTSVQAVVCTAENTPPEMPENFNINEHVEVFEDANKGINGISGIYREPARALFMAGMFAPGRKYDLKSNPNYMSGEKLGNFFFGVASDQMGYSQQQAVHIGAIVQQYQDFNNDPNTSVIDPFDVNRLAAKILYAALTGLGDNPGDSSSIEGGHDYSSIIYANDADSSTNSNSCDTDSSAPGSGSGPGSGVGFGGGWIVGLWSGWGACFGNCVSGGNVEVTDLPR